MMHPNTNKEFRRIFGIPMKSHPNYNSWKCMIHRCHNPKRESYSRYGGKGILVCDRWHSFTKFCQDMGGKPSKTHSIDRIDNNKGYEPSNCRWATPIQQRRNQKPRTGNISGHEGIFYHKVDNRYTVRLTRDGIAYHIQGYFKSVEEALVIRDKVLSDYAKGKDISSYTRKTKSGELYINLIESKNPWMVRLPIKGKYKSLGSYPTLEEAIKVRDNFLKTK